MPHAELAQVVIAALLHDIGKFGQRAFPTETVTGADGKIVKINSSHKTENEHIFSPKKFRTSQYTHQHVLYTDFFMEHVLPLPLAWEKDGQEEVTHGNLARLAASHHNPTDEFEEKCIQEADEQSAGLDRIEDKSVGNHFTARLQNVFSALALKNRTNPKYHRLCKLSDYQHVFPYEEKPELDKEEAQKQYEAHYRAFCKELENLGEELVKNAIPVPLYIASLTSILEEYTWCVPSCTYQTAPDIPLYDHLITTAAIAQAIYMYHKATGEKDPAKAKYILFLGELSGIQNYIFTGENNSGYAKTLRARSFHLQALTRSLVLEITRRLEIFPIAKIMDAGGKFILLLPDTHKTKEVLQSIRLEIQKFLVEEFQGEVRMQMAQVELDKEGMKQQKFVTHLNTLNDALEQDKLHAFQSYFEKNPSPVMGVDWGGNKECPYCNRNPADNTTDDDGEICEFCKNLIKIGAKLPKATYAVFAEKSTSRDVVLPLFGGLCLSLYEKDKLRKCDIKNAHDIINMRSRDMFTSQAIAGHTPVDEDDNLLTFEDFANAATVNGKNGKEGVPMLGVFKADVDNLGLLFSIGFKGKAKEEEKGKDDKDGEKGIDCTSVARFSHLSRMLNFFFSEYLVQEIKNDPVLKSRIYVVFAGGDDLFLLGTWTDIIDFALKIRTDFASFTAQSQDVTLSAGISMAKAKLPMATMAEMGEKCLDEAKKKREEDANGKEKESEKSPKNACHIFGNSLFWHDFDKQVGKGSDLVEKIHEQEVTQGLVRRLLEYSDDCKAFCEEGKLKKGLYLSHLAYDLERNVMGEVLKTEIQQWATDLPAFTKARVAITYALYKTRKQ